MLSVRARSLAWALFALSVRAPPAAAQAAAVPEVPNVPVTATPAPAPLVDAADYAPDVVREIRYASPDNFTGQVVPGYEAPRCWLTLPAAQALAKAQQNLQRFGLGLKVWDCYRPQRAVDAFVRWSRASDESLRSQGGGQDLTRFDYLPRIRRQDTFRRGYLARRSSHSCGTAVDVTLVPQGAAASAPRLQRPPCTAPYDEAAAGDEAALDLGTGFDCLDALAHTHNPNVAAEQRALRMLLTEVMQRAGFRGYAREWWHFVLDGPRQRCIGYDRPIRD